MTIDACTCVRDDERRLTSPLPLFWQYIEDIEDECAATPTIILPRSLLPSHTSDESHAWLVCTIGIAIALLAMPARPTVACVSPFTQTESHFESSMPHICQRY
jgi:hypothetical protein